MASESDSTAGLQMTLVRSHGREPLAYKPGDLLITLTPGAAVKDIHLHGQLSLSDAIHDMAGMFISRVGLQLAEHHGQVLQRDFVLALSMERIHVLNLHDSTCRLQIHTVLSVLMLAPTASSKP